MTMLEPLGPAAPLEADSHRRVLTSAALLGALTICIKLVALAKDWIVADRFGSGDELDAFLIAFVLPSYAVSVLAHSFASGFVPTYIRIWHHEGLAQAQRLHAGVMARGCGVLALVTLALAALAPYLVPLVGSNFAADKLALAERLFYVVVGVLAASGLSAIFAAVLNAHERFLTAALAPAAIPLATIAALGLAEERAGIYALAVGTLLGFVLECVLLAGGLQVAGLLVAPRWTGADASLRHVGSQYLPIALGSLLMSSSLVVDQSMAASLGSGNVSVLNYGNKIVALVLNIVAVSLSTVLFPRFARMIAAGDWSQLRQTFRLYARAILLLGIPLTALLALVSEPLVRLLFERGAFTPETTRAVAWVQICLLPQVPFAVLVMLGYRVLSALDGNRLVLAVGALNLLMNVTGNYVLMRIFGVNGIALSTSLVYLLATAATLWAIRRRLLERGAPPGPLV